MRSRRALKRPSEAPYIRRMKQGRSRRVFTLGLVLIVSGMSSINWVESAVAHESPYGLFQCSQESKLAVDHVRVGFISPPADGWGDGVINSFYGRAIDATTRMSSALDIASPTPHFLNWIGVISPSNTAAIAFRISELDAYGTGVLGRVNMSSTCLTMHGTPTVAFPGSVYIDIDIRSDWFTQEDSRRALWEGCTSTSTYTCSKMWDAGGVMLHELGHAVGIAHPQHTDQHRDSYATPKAVDLATCANALDQATMCAFVSGDHRSHWRTLHSWDNSSLSYRY